MGSHPVEGFGTPISGESYAQAILDEAKPVQTHEGVWLERVLFMAGGNTLPTKYEHFHCTFDSEASWEISI